VFLNVFTVAPELKSRAGTGSSFNVHVVDRSFGSCDLDQLFLGYSDLERVDLQLFKGPIACIETFDWVLEVERYSLALLDISNELCTVQEVRVIGGLVRSPIGSFTYSFHDYIKAGSA